MKPQYRITLLLLLVCCPSFSWAQHDPTRDLVKSTVDRVLATPALSAGFQGVEIEDVKSGEVLYSHNASKVFIPASNNKLITSSGALALLGRDFKYVTTAVGSVAVENGILKGDLILRGSGDPTLETSNLAQLVDDLKARGITNVTGAVKFDDSLFDQQLLGEGWEWDDEPYYYAAEISALNIDHNVARIVVKPGSTVGSPATIQVPEGMEKAFTIQNSASTTSSDQKSNIHVSRLRGTNILQISGTVAEKSSGTNASEVVTIEQPAEVAAMVFATLLQQKGIEIGNAHIMRLASGADHAGEHVLATHSSTPLSEILTTMNKPSDNLIAECLLKTVGAVKRGSGSSGISGTGTALVREWLLSIGLNKEQLRQVDGSGMSRQNYVSPLNIVRLLRYWYANPEGKYLIDSLPIAGVDGTLRRRMVGTKAQNNCRAKTGSLGQVSSLSGYVTTQGGDVLAFSILTNNQVTSSAPCVEAQNQIVTFLAGLQKLPGLSGRDKGTE